MKKEKICSRGFANLQASFLLVAIGIVGTMFFLVPQGAFAAGNDMQLAAAATTQTNVKAEGASAKTYTDESIEKLFEGKGVGKKTLSAVCKENGIDLNLAKKKLAKQNIQMKDDETLFDAAQRVSKSPIDVMKIILKGEPIKK